METIVNDQLLYFMVIMNQNLDQVENGPSGQFTP